MTTLGAARLVFILFFCFNRKKEREEIMGKHFLILISLSLPLLVACEKKSTEAGPYSGEVCDPKEETKIPRTLN
jgi:hypothetical protein